MSAESQSMRPPADGVLADWATAGAPTGEDLAELVRNLPLEEQQAVGMLVAKAIGSGRPLDTITLVHESLKADIADMIAGEYEDAQTKKAPPVLQRDPQRPRVGLPREHLELDHRLDHVIEARASRRDFVRTPLTLAELSSLLHYSYGIRRYMPAYNTRNFPMRMVASAGSLQPVELYLVVNGVEDVTRGLYHYDAADHALELIDEGNMRRTVVQLSIMQEWLSHAGVVLFLVSTMRRSEWKYKARGYRFVHVDAGVLTGQLYLVATALRLRTCAVAAFIDDAVNAFLGLDGRDEFVTLMMGVGTRAEEP